jgi:hypothetical protein
MMHGQQNLKKNFFYDTLAHFRTMAFLSVFLHISTFQFRIWGKSTASLQQLDYSPMHFKKSADAKEINHHWI